MYDYLIVGAGFAGSVAAERLAAGFGKRVLIVDKRPHIGGNAYDEYDDHGLLIHKYGPHIFHTNSKDVFEYLSRFTAWRPYQHRVLASVDGQLLPIPINLDTINRLYGLRLNSFELEAFFASKAEPVAVPRTSEDVIVGKVGRTRNSSATTRGSSGRSIPRSSTPRSPPACRCGPTGTIGTSPTPTRRCRCTATRGCSNACWRIRRSRSC
jgi:UDP-galactopyranose mutase